MKKFLIAFSASKWEFLGIGFLIIGAECMRLAGIQAKELKDVWAEAEKITKETSGD
jgi:hypothetical protein